MTEIDEDALPFAGLHVIDGGALASRRVLVLVDGKPVAQLPATVVRYEMLADGVGQLLVGVPACRAAMTGGNRAAVGRI